MRLPAGRTVRQLRGVECWPAADTRSKEGEKNMAQRLVPPFHADHVGSLLRPAELHAARARAKDREIGQAALRTVEDECIRGAVALQESVGLHAVTDGEFRRDWWHVDFLHGFDGVELTRHGDIYKDARFKNVEEQ